METTAADFELVKNLRNSRRKAVEMASAGALAPVLGAAPDSLESQVYVVKLLDVHPSLGKVAGRRLLANMQLDSFVRVGQLTESQRSTILTSVGEAS